MIQRVIKEVEVFQTSDGKQWNSEIQAELHQKELDRTPEQKAIDEYRSSYDNLLKNGYHLESSGIWEVRGEDPNADFDGRHHYPFLGVVRGTLEQAILWANKQKNWKYWGNGGKITAVNILDLDKEEI